MTRKREEAGGLAAGCSALAWATLDHRHLWGRNYDFDRLAEGSGMIFLPRGTEYWGVTAEGQAFAPHSAVYACMGMGLRLSPTPVLYEGINEKGLMGGQLYYRGFAHYPDVPVPSGRTLQPPVLVYHLLAQCDGVEEAVRYLREEVELAEIPMLGTVAPLHWMFHDRTGESVVVEPDREGLHIYRGAMGVMTNSPGYPWHKLNLLNYAALRNQDYPTVELGGERQEQCFSGSGAQGLPGDWSSPSRFVRLAFLRSCALPGRDEAEGVSRMLHLFQSAAFPLGAVRVSSQSHVTELDREVLPFDYTGYTSIYCAESGRAYWTTYENQRVQVLNLAALQERREPLIIPLDKTPDFWDRTPGTGGGQKR